MLFSRWLVLAAMTATCGAAAPVSPPVVAVIDSGVARTAELSGLVLAEYDVASVPARTAFQPKFDHGTMVATILARAAARQVRIISFRIDDPGGCPPQLHPPCQPDPRPVARAIRQATTLGVRAINLSLSLQDDPDIVAAVREAAREGVAVVMAAGNHGLNQPDNLSMARAGYPNAVLVGALGADGRPWAQSNRPSPGLSSTCLRSPYRYAWQRGVDVPAASATGVAVTGTGTSFAAPIETARLLADGPGARLRETTLAEAPQTGTLGGG